MDNFWGTALWKESIWRGDGGVEPDPAMCSVSQGQKGVSPGSEQRPRATASARSPQLPPPDIPLLCPLGAPLGPERIL